MQNTIFSPLITIAVVSYNQNKYLKKCLKSIFDQTYQNIDLILVDDFSCDFDYSDISDYIRIHAPENIQSISVSPLDTHHGTVGAYKHALSLAKGDYILFLGGDDTLASPSVLENIAEELSPGNIDLLQVHSSLEFHGTRTILPNKNSCNALKENDFFSTLKHAMNQPYHQLLCLQSAFIKISVMKSFDPFPGNYYHAADWPIYLQMMFNGKNIALADIISTVMGNTGAYHYPSIGSTYIHKAYLNEASQSIKEFAVSDCIHKSSFDDALRFLNLSNSFKNKMVKDYEWTYCDIAQKIKWRYQHADEIMLNSYLKSANQPTLGIFSIVNMFFSVIALFCLYLSVDRFPYLKTFDASAFPFLIISIAFVIKMLLTTKRLKNKLVLIDYPSITLYLVLLTFCAFFEKHSSVSLSVHNFVVLLLLAAVIVFSLTIFIRVIHKIKRKLIRYILIKEAKSYGNN